MSKAKSGAYFVIEGQDATGKSTQADLLANYFRKRGKEVLVIHEPDGDLPSAHSLRDLIKNKDYNLEPETHVLLFTAARNELWHKLAKPVLAEGGIVIAARNWWSTIAYQGYGQGVHLDLIEHTMRSFLPKRYLRPDHAVILTLDNNLRTSRLTDRNDAHTKDTFESKPFDFQKVVTRSYLKIAQQYDIPTLDASPDPATLHLKILKLFSLKKPD
jgi:dTMP kinase